MDKKDPLRILFVLEHAGFLIHFDSVVRRLRADNHEVVVLRGAELKEPDVDRALLACEAEVGCELGFMRDRKDIWWWLQSKVRLLIDYANYFRPQHPSSSLAHRVLTKSKRRRYDYARRALRSRAAVKLLSNKIVLELLRSTERFVPPDRNMTRQLEGLQPDVVLASPVLYPHSRDVEYIKAAKAFGIPTIVAVASWDNPTTKGTMHEMPDYTLVWNRSLLDEMVQLHDVPESSLIVTGAPTFDALFDIEPLTDRESFCRQIGLDPATPFFLYLCSSQAIAGDESAFVKEFVGSLSKHPITRGAGVLVRPHPQNAFVWNDPSVDNIAIFPSKGDRPDTPNSRQDYYESLYYCEAAVGVNTTAMLVAAIADKPCITIITEHYRDTQTGRSHFQHLLDGDYLEVAHSFSEAAEVLAAVLNGNDAKALNRRRFVRDFIRPYGLNQPAAEIVVSAIEKVADGRTMRPVVSFAVAQK